MFGRHVHPYVVVWAVSLPPLRVRIGLASAETRQPDSADELQEGARDVLAGVPAVAEVAIRTLRGGA